MRWLRAVGILAGLGLAGCGAETPGGGGGGVTIQGAVVSGRVEAMGSTSGLGGVAVQLGARSTTTNEQGWFVFADVPAQARAVVHATRSGYMQATEALRVQAGTAYHVEMVLVPSAGTRSVSAAAGGTVQAGGVSITIPVNAFVTATGAAVTGDVSLSIAALDPSNEAGMDAFPGEFVGRRADATEEPLESFGLFAIEARQGAVALNLAPGRALEVSAPIATAAASDAPATMPLWSLDESTGVWREEGEATRDGSSYRATVPHLSWWNFDMPYLGVTTCVKLCVVDGDNRPVRGAHVRLQMLDYRSATERDTGSDGCALLNARASSRVRITTAYNGRTGPVREVTTQDLITNTNRTPPNCQDLGTVTLEPAVAQMVLSWGERPSDLDSHLTGPGASGRFHVYYGAKGSMTSAPFCALDTDDTSSFGPEVTTIHRAASGVYRYAVHNYSGQTSHRIEASGATVTLMVPGLGYFRRFDVPTVNPANGNIWTVADLYAEGTRIVRVEPVNRFTSGSATTGYNP